MIMGERVSHRWDFSQIEINIEKQLHIYSTYSTRYIYIAALYTYIAVPISALLWKIPSKLQRTIYFDSQK